jgi:hypothetical protein
VYIVCAPYLPSHTLCLILPSPTGINPHPIQDLISPPILQLKNIF